MNVTVDHTKYQMPQQHQLTQLTIAQTQNNVGESV